MYIYLIHNNGKSSVYYSNKEIKYEDKTLVEITDDNTRIDFWADKFNTKVIKTLPKKKSSK